ncbi:hypothetical protein LMG24238_02625 [Paraburkholderia sediminicola]|uniref:Uncharacterized protein n=1 Tax=Paraburkholderia sediminicola TaxID=458836 RepID=A0A6J5AWM0_9BURK|nr:hypothetical protein LMG24238_02625 [Paraburkholderia sediminicola]
MSERGGAHAVATGKPTVYASMRSRGGLHPPR